MDPLAAMRVAHRLPRRAAAGPARIGRWVVDEATAATALTLQRLFAPGAEGHPLPMGEYAVLVVDGAYSMCDAPFTLRNYGPFLDAAEGDVLLTGLGLGCLVHGLVARPAVRSVTVLEIHPEVIGLVGPSVRHPAVEVVRADALAWRPPAGRRFDHAMLDLGDDRRLVARLVAHHAGWADALWPDPEGIPDGPLTPDLRFLVDRARAAA
ncbi:MAG: hypothetical protein MUE51_13070 [Thermoleophilia bacterium]|jgi:hypothetical protein|nr:hypothetical protein [Thermoleophilia bacterium]